MHAINCSKQMFTYRRVPKRLILTCNEISVGARKVKANGWTITENVQMFSHNLFHEISFVHSNFNFTYEKKVVSLQLHSDEQTTFCDSINGVIMKNFKVKNNFVFNTVAYFTL